MSYKRPFVNGQSSRRRQQAEDAAASPLDVGDVPTTDNCATSGMDVDVWQEIMRGLEGLPYSSRDGEYE